MVGDKAHRVKGFTSRTSRNQHSISLHILLHAYGEFYVLKQQTLSRHLSATGIATSQASAIRLHETIAILLQLCDIILQDRILPHAGIHGRRYYHRSLCCKDSRCEHIVANAISHLANDVGCGRSNQKHVGLLCQRHMLHLELEVAVEGIYQAFVASKGFECCWSNKVASILCHYHMHLRLLLHEHRCQICYLVCSYASRNSKNYGLSFKHNGIILILDRTTNHASHSLPCELYGCFRQRTILLAYAVQLPQESYWRKP